MGRPPEPLMPRERIEPIGTILMTEECRTSMAISHRRIADAMTRIADALDRITTTDGVLALITTLKPAIEALDKDTP